MVRLTPMHGGCNVESMPLAVGLFVSVSALVTLCAKHARGAAKKYSTEAISDSKVAPKSPLASPKTTSDSRVAPKSPLPSPKRLLATISNKAVPFMHKKRGGDGFEVEAEEEAGFGEGGLWQREILMGEKCQPPEFSGVIYYDSFGNQLSQLPPRSPRASPLPSLSFPVARDAN